MASVAYKKNTVRNRMEIPDFVAEGRPSVWSTADMNLLVQILRSLTNPQIVRGTSDKVFLSDSNLTIQVASGDSGTATVLQLQLKNVRDDYLSCVTWDGTTAGTTPVYVAKEWHTRTSLVSATIRGEAQTFTYSAGPSEAWAAGTATTYNRTRTADNGVITEDQCIIPPWTENEVVLAVSAETGLTTTVGDGSQPIGFALVGRSATWGAM